MYHNYGKIQKMLCTFRTFHVFMTGNLTRYLTGDTASQPSASKRKPSKPQIVEANYSLKMGVGLKK
ncbi:hypothetical protein JCM19037_4884 [Geomicrobium sp. JCM 19037]|nr:hypothetical protein JCM19037_4884 [Geomicrobium sp. JCM 19037]